MQHQLPLDPVPYKVPKYLSPSAITTFDQCPMKYRYQKLDKLDTGTTSAMAVGSYTHEILEYIYDYPADERTKQTAKQIARELWADKWAAEFEEVVDEDDPNAFRWKVWWCVENYFKVEDPSTIEPDGREHKARGEVNGVPIFGIVDRWMDLGMDKIGITDYKTGRPPKQQYSFEKKLQLILYAELLEAEMGVETDYVELIYLKDGGVSVMYDPSEDLRDAVKVSVRNTWDELNEFCATGEFETRTGPLCNWCDFKDTICPAWN